jgi:hypothetical protein
MKQRMMVLCLFCSVLCLFNPAAQAIDMGKSSYSSKEVDLKTTTRRLFTDYLIWHRIFIVETLGAAQDVSKAQARFQKSQDDIVGMFASYYGDSTGTQLTNLFNQYSGLISDYAYASKIHADKTDAVNKIHSKIDEIAGALSMANMNWVAADLSTMIKKYSDSLLSEIDLQTTMLGSIDAKIMDSTLDLSMQMADTFSSGIAQQYPGKFW